jgi:hypothetical protein
MSHTRIAMIGLGFLLLLTWAVPGWTLTMARFVHAAPMAAERIDTSISLYIAGDFSANGFPHSYQLHDIQYRHFTNFFGYPAANFDVVIRKKIGGKKIIDTTIALESGFHNWIILTGDGDNQPFDLMVVRSQLPSWDSGDHALLFVHSAPVAPQAPGHKISIVDWQNTPFGQNLESLEYGQAAEIIVPPGPSHFQINAAENGAALLKPAPIDLQALNQGTAVLLIGDGVNKPLSMLAVPGGELEMLEFEDPAVAVQVDNSVLGWWDTANSGAGEGLFLQPMPDQERLVGTIYTYADDDSGQQRWFVIESCRPFESGTGDCPQAAGFDGRLARATVFFADGARMGGSEPSTLTVAGWIEFEFFNCDQGLASMSLYDGSNVNWELQRLTRTVPCTLD